MAKPINLSTEGDLMYQILQQLDKLLKVAGK